MFETILNGLMVAISIALIILCLLQSGKSDGIVNALTGQSSNLFAHQKERGAELVLTRVTAGLAIVFFIIAIILRMS
ncbi:preprotein translocase subunit SecG [Thomasclavelia sp.]|uniref:preprotein translocase subunit SecG n=1 Tax=Thomasclavelia sp. TaxID=3025757 RepID=UPI0025DA9813|nr:preprotein translocase subunit SecG [Thomasclavelia sp.]